MELDRARIAIRERSAPDIMDLALRISRLELGSIAVLTAASVLPWVLLNRWALHRFFVTTGWLDNSQSPEELIFSWIGCFALLLAAILIEAPLATAPLTLYLGQTTFASTANIGRLLREYLSSLPLLFVLQACVRAVLIPWGITGFLPFVFWPYLNEVVLLERNPLLRKKSTNQMNTLTRLSRLHSLNPGELMVRAMFTAMLAGFLSLAILGSLWLLNSLLSENWSVSPALALDGAQLAFWTVAIFLTVVRFLSYLDLRIRAEGWELELRMRAEAIRLAPEFS